MGRKRLVVLSVILAVGFGHGASYAYEDGDFQIWHTEDQEVKVVKNTTYTMEEEFRYGGDAHELYYHHYDWGIVYDVTKYLSLGAAYRQVYDLKSGKFKEENRPHVTATVKWALCGFDCEDRNRFEYRHFRYQDDEVRYRNKLTIKLPWKLTRFNVRPYVADEVFADLNNAAFVRNRFYSGMGFELNKNLKGEVYYMLQSSKNPGAWRDVNALGLKLKLVF